MKLETIAALERACYRTVFYRHHRGAVWKSRHDCQTAVCHVDTRQGGRVEERDADGRLTRQHPKRQPPRRLAATRAQLAGVLAVLGREEQP